MTDFDGLPRRSQIGRMRALAANALPSYGMAGAPFRLLSADQFFNTSFLVTREDRERFVLRIHRPSTNPQKRTKIESELWWLGHVREHLGLAVPEPVLTTDGELLVSAEAEGAPGPRFCVLFRWMDGRFLHRGLRPRHLELVGRMTARLHNDSARLAVPDWFLRNTVDRVDADYEESVAGILTRERSPDATPTARGVVRRARAAAEELGEGPEAFGVIHADIHQWNYLFREGEIELIDFDDSGWGHYLYDLAVTSQQLVHMPDGPRLQAALFRGYRQVRDLSTGEEALVETFRMLREIQDLAWLLERREDPAYVRFLPQIGSTLAEMERFLKTG